MCNMQKTCQEVWLTSVQVVEVDRGPALQASCIQYHALLVMREHVASLEALHNAVLVAAVSLADLAVNLQPTGVAHFRPAFMVLPLFIANKHFVFSVQAVLWLTCKIRQCIGKYPEMSRMQE